MRDGGELDAGSDHPRRRRVVVTGIGAVTSAGWGTAVLWDALRTGRMEIGPFSRFDHSSQRTHVAGEVPTGPPAEFRTPKGFARLSFAERFALYAAIEAVADARLSGMEDLDAGVFFGTSTGGLIESEWYLERLWQEDDAASLNLMAAHQLNAPGDAVARHLNVTGPVESISSACASSALAIGAALDAVRDGEVEIAIVGGADCLCTTTYSGFNSLRSVDDGPCRPFRGDRKGLSLGEGAAVLVLESLDRAVSRGARIRAELLGAGASCDASHMTAPDPQGRGAAAAILRALVDAESPLSRVGLLNAHGTGTPLNDSSEAAAFRLAFGELSPQIPVTATKSVVGHLLGSSGAVEAVATVLCVEAQEAHPAAGAGTVDSTLQVDLVVDTPRRLRPDGVVVSTSLGFGGANAALVFARCSSEE